MRDFFRASIAKGQGRTNPLFPVAKTPRWKRLLFASATLVVPFGGGYLGVHTFSQPQYLLTDIEITGAACLDQGVVQKEIENVLSERAGLFFTKANKLLFNPQTVIDRLTRDLPIDRAELTIEGNTLRVVIQEDVVMVLVHSADNWLLSDLNGKIIRTLTDDEITHLDSPSTNQSLPLNKIPKIILNESVTVDTQDAVYAPNRLAALGELDKGLRSQNLTPDRYSLEKRKDTWITVVTKEKPYKMYFDLENPLPAQLKILSSVISEHQEIPEMSYIDLRFGNRVYMK